VLAPNGPGELVQCIDVRDLAHFMVHTLEQKTMGIFNADAPAGSLTMGRLLETCRTVSKSDARLVWGPTPFLEAQQVRPWADLPVWIPTTSQDSAGQGQISTARADAAGLTHRPLSDTVADTLAWHRTWPAERRDAPLKAGIAPEREREVLAAWKATTPGAP
jgi:2'-hydroxyisoflavone reductase